MATGAQQQPLSMAELADKLARLETDMAETKEGIKQNTTHINTINTKLDKAGTRVAFTAVYIDRTKTKEGQPIVFRDVVLNEGGGYSGATGVFTAPVAGTYIFSVSVEKEEKDEEEKVSQPDRVDGVIMVNNTKYACLIGSSTSSGNNSVSTQLEVGQTVWVQACSNPDLYQKSYSNCFTGALVQTQL